MTPVLTLDGPGSSYALADLAARVAEREPGTVLRVVERDDRLAVLASTPFDVLVMRAVPLVATVGTEVEHRGVDLVVEAETLAATASEGDGSSLRLPGPVDPLRWVWPLPPWSGWVAQDPVRTADLRAARQAAVQAFRTAVEAMPPAARSRAALETLAADQWDVDVAPGVSVRMAHAAAAHGFLPSGAGAEDPVAGVLTRGPWARLDLPGGTVLARRGGLTLRG